MAYPQVLFGGSSRPRRGLMRVLGWLAPVAASALVASLPAGCSRKSAGQSAGALPGTGGTAGSGGGGSTSGMAGTTGAGAPGGASGGAGGSGTGGATTPPTGPCDGGSCPADAGGSCPNVLACGGDIVGAWIVTSSCLSVAGQLDVSAIGFACIYMKVTGSLQVTGSWTATSDGRFSDDTITAGDEQIVVPNQCAFAGTTVHCRDFNQPLQLLGYSSATCVDAPNGMDMCSCPAVVNQSGGAGLVSYYPEPARSGQFTTSGNVLTTDTGTQYSYCISGNTMTWTPQSATPTVTGTIVFERQ
jgi:hypothetical protein